MSTPRQPKDDRLEELLMKGATHGLSSREANEVVVRGGAYDQSYDVAAASIDLATLDIEAMPKDLEARLLAQVEGALAPPSSGGMTPSLGPAAKVVPLRRDWLRYAGWMAAAAMALLFVGDWARRRDLLGPALAVRAATPAQERASLLATAKDVKVLPWKPTPDAAGAHASGDVVWSPSEQRGYMRFQGLAANDKTKLEYQLWIFDKAQDYPVDGGVFDVTGQTEVVVPIHSKLHVDTPTLFAVTVEKPGGVVVSKRERIVVTAGES